VTRRLRSALAGALVALLSACSGGAKTSPEPVSTSPTAVPGSASPKNGASPSQAPGPLAKSSVTLYFPSAEGNTLVAETREIVDTKRPEDRGAQILAALLDGPKAEGVLPAFPAGTTLRRLWVRDDGNAYADFSEELLGAATGGSADEILTVYAIVDSLTANVPEIRRVGILVAGRERATFGHLDLTRPLSPDLTLAEGPKATE
jgi:spore germination protein GerM